MDTELLTVVVVAALLFVRLAIPIAAIWLLSKALKFSLAVLP